MREGFPCLSLAPSVDIVAEPDMTTSSCSAFEILSLHRKFEEERLGESLW